MAKTNWTLDPYPFLSEKLRPFYEVSQAGFFHVTTRASMVEKSRRLKSRAELDQEFSNEESIRGLGGGPDSVVSFTFRLDRAMTLLTAIRSMARTLQGDMSRMDLLLEMLEWTGFPEDPIWSSWIREADEEPRRRLFQGISNRFLLPHRPMGEEDLENIGRKWFWTNLFADNEVEIDSMSDFDLYDAVRDFESFLDAFLGEAKGAHGQGPSLCTKTIGFMADFRAFRSIEPDQVSIVQVACQKHANVTIIARECELRIHPSNVKLVMNRVEERGSVAAVLRAARLLRSLGLQAREVHRGRTSGPCWMSKGTMTISSPIFIKIWLG